MEGSGVQENSTTLLPIQNPTITRPPPETTAISQRPRFPTIDGPLGLNEEQSLKYARRFYKFGFLLLPWLWGLNCFYLWPVLRHYSHFPTLHHYVFRSAIAFTVATAIMCTWALTFSIGGESLFGPVWNQLVMYNVADDLGLTGFM